MPAEQQYLDLYAKERDTICSHSSEPLNALRDTARQHFERLGFPTHKDERCKYTDAAAAFAPDYGLNLTRIEPAAASYPAYRCKVPNLNTFPLFVVNDSVVPSPATGTPLPDGVTCCSLREASVRHAELVNAHYGRLADNSTDGITALNTMLAQDGLFIHVAAGVSCPCTLQIVNVAAAPVDMLSTRRILVVIEPEAEASLLFCDHSDGRHRYLTSQVVEAFVGKDARLNLYSVEETHHNHQRFCHLYVNQESGSQLTLNGITLMAGLTRNRTDIRLSGEKAVCNAYGCVVADGTEHVDNNLLVDHSAAACTSDILYKYVLDGRAVGAFAGHILVREKAQHTSSNETNSNLCTSPEARMYTRPILEIYADDVKCNHGSTIGRLDEKALFYMRQRGIEEAEARLLLQHAFVNDIIQRIGLEPLRLRLAHLVEMRFRGLLRHCAGCTMCPPQ